MIDPRDNVVPLFKEPEPDCFGHIKCLACKHEWPAVWLSGTCEFECPECGCLKGRAKNFVLPPADEPHYECGCGNDEFMLLQDGAHCNVCGDFATYEELSDA